jgi:CyaY protein
MLSESEFVASSTRVLNAIGGALDSAIDDADADLDWSLNDGVLTIDCGARGKLIVNRHVPNRELWIAAKSGGFHFRADGGVWRDTRSGEEFALALTRLLQEQAGIGVALPALPAVQPPAS